MEWQPIETAPKDGTTILAYNGAIGIYTTAYQSHEPNEGDRWPCGFAGWLGKWYCYPSHLMPLPAQPKETA